MVQSFCCSVALNGIQSCLMFPIVFVQRPKSPPIQHFAVVLIKISLIGAKIAHKVWLGLKETLFISLSGGPSILLDLPCSFVI